MSAPFTTGVRVCNRQTPQSGTRCCIHAAPSAWGGMGLFPQDTSAKGLPLCRARPAVTAWLPRMELNATEAFGVCTVVRFAHCSLHHGRRPQLPEVPWTTPFPMRYPAEQLEARQHNNPKNLLFSPCAMPPEDQLRQDNTFCCSQDEDSPENYSWPSANCPHCSSVLREMNTECSIT